MRTKKKYLFLLKEENIKSANQVYRKIFKEWLSVVAQQYFRDKNVVQEFNKPATPEQNPHIESYYSIMEKVINAMSSTIYPMQS